LKPNLPQGGRVKNYKHILIGLPVLCVILILLAGCGISKSDYEALQAQKTALEAEKQTLQNNYNTLQTENNALKDQKTSLEAEKQTLQDNYDKLIGEQKTLQTEKDTLQTNYNAVNKELTEIKKVYPPRDFSSLSELRNWLLANDVSKQPVATTAENLYSKALEIQEDALADGYVVSVDLDYEAQTDSFYISCVTIINGDIWAWHPENDEPVQYTGLGKVK
jgi:cell division protein FtsL